VGAGGWPIMIPRPFAFGRIDHEAYARILALVAMADGTVKREELALYEERMARLLIHPDTRAVYRTFLSEQSSIQEVVSGVDDYTILAAIRDALLMAKIDGEIHSEEVRTIQQIVDGSHIPSNRLNAMHDWVDEGLEWMAKGERLAEVSLKT